VGGGLTAKGGSLTGFEIAGADRKFVPAEAAIEGATIVVSSPSISAPVSVRYAWSDDPRCNLYNADGLPASPFHSGE
jgi:sialate O-acetylesterase